MLGDSHRKICEGLRNLKSVRRTPLARYRRYVLAVFLPLCMLFPANVLNALHEVDHRFTVEGRICGEDGEGIGAVLVSVKDTRADVSGKGKTDNDGFFRIVLHLHNENQGDPLVVQSGELEAIGRVELNPDDPKTERIVTINLGQSCRALPVWRQTWVLAGLGALLVIILMWIIPRLGGKNVKNSAKYPKWKGRRK